MGDGVISFVSHFQCYILRAETNSERTERMTENNIYDSETERLDKINERLSLIQLKKGLTFGTDSYFLAAFSHAKPGGVCVELGGGTGVVSLLAAARNKFKTVYSVEIQEYFASLIKRNAVLNDLCDSVIPICRDVRELTAADVGGECDSVISNPPYMKQLSGKQNDSPEMNTARREENGGIYEFCSCAKRLLRHGGYFTVVYRPNRAAELFYSMKVCGIEPKRAVMLYPTVASKPCLILVEGKKGASEGIVFSRPLIIYKNDREYTDDMQAVYDNFSLEHMF